MNNLKRFSQDPLYVDFASAVLQKAAEKPEYLLGFSISHHPVFRWLRRGQAAGWPYFYPVVDDWSPIMGDRFFAQKDGDYFSDENDDRAWEGWRSNYARSEKKPYLVRVCVAPTGPDTIQLRRQLEGICAQQTNFFAIVEDRIPAHLCALEGGRQVTFSSQRGTLGGFLKDQYGNVFGVTCGHVAQTAGAGASMQDMGGSSVPLGSVAGTNWPLAHSASTTLCQPSSALNKVDIALIDVNGMGATKNVRHIGAIIDKYGLCKLGSGHRVCMSGAKSGYGDYDITGYITTYRVKDGSNYYCFTDIFEISGVPSTSPLDIFGTYIPVPRDGDSGAWVCCPAGSVGTAVCGMLFAADHHRGYACFTDEMDSWAADPSRGYTLSVL